MMIDCNNSEERNAGELMAVHNSSVLSDASRNALARFDECVAAIKASPTPGPSLQPPSTSENRPVSCRNTPALKQSGLCHLYTNQMQWSLRVCLFQMIASLVLCACLLAKGHITCKRSNQYANVIADVRIQRFRRYAYHIILVAELHAKSVKYAIRYFSLDGHAGRPFVFRPPDSCCNPCSLRYDGYNH